MQELKCPKCGEVFQVDESGYASIVKQVRDKEFKKELEDREKDLTDAAAKNLDIVLLRKEQETNLILKKKDEEIAKKEQELAELKERIRSSETEKELAVQKALEEQTEKIHTLEIEIENEKRDKTFAIRKLTDEKELAVANERSEKEKELAQKENELIKLQGEIKNKDVEIQMQIESLKKEHEQIIKGKDETIEFYKDFKAKQSTKMLGETLEQHCAIQFNQIRMTAFPNAYFEKDNDAHTGSKGDFIFREMAEDGTEFLSIMFEMKNEADTTATKHKNEDFFKELDKDRREKNCEYAILVSLLEQDNELYNAGIVDVSYKYPKMYVIRPQFFIPMISLLRNAALNSLEYKQELAVVKNQQLDIMHFEENMETFKKGFARNYRLASEQFETAISDIDAAIKKLEKIKKELTQSENNLRLANDKAQDLSIKALTKNAPTVRTMFDELKSKQED